jgi:hypothetical protein
MNIRLLKAEWSAPQNGYLTYQILILNGPIKTGAVHRASRCVHEMTYKERRGDIEADVRKAMGEMVMDALFAKGHV